MIAVSREMRATKMRKMRMMTTLKRLSLRECDAVLFNNSDWAFVYGREGDDGSPSSYFVNEESGMMDRGCAHERSDRLVKSDEHKCSQH